MISVVVPTYNRTCIITCLEALRAQENISAFEVIVVAREIPEYLQVYFKAIAPIHWKLIYYIQPGNGPAKNHAVALYAQGEFIAFIDDDCIPDKYWLARLWTAQRLSNADIVVGACLPADWNNPYLVAHQMHIQYFLETLTKPGLIYPSTVCGTTMNMLIKKETFLRLKGFDILFAKHFGDDRDFNVRWAADANTRAVFNYSAMVAHNHPFTLRTFLRTSFAYGVGIQKCAELAKEKGYKDIPAPPDRSEYLDIVEYLISKARFGILKTLYSAFMVVISQEVKRIGMRYAISHPEYSSK